jgi:hypothetical protein
VRVCRSVSLAGASAVKVYSDVARLEGDNSSCLVYVAAAVDYDAAKASCASAGYHLLTTAATVRTTGTAAQTLMFYARDVAVVNTSAWWWMGGELATPSWVWVDGTSSANLNCGSVGCGGLWSASQPDYAEGSEQRLLYWPGGGAAGDAPPAFLPMTFVCEREFVCPAGAFCALNNDSIALCPAGTFSASGATACTNCSAGYVCPVASNSSTPVGAMCPPGTFSLSGATTCTNCSAGYACPAGSTSSTPAAAICPTGRFSVPGATSCTNCSAGYACPVGSTSATPAAALCPAGRFSVAGAAACTNCSAGYACPAGSTSATPAAAVCPAGSFVPAGGVACLACAAGYFGNVSALGTRTCSGPCTPGYYCDAGSVSPTQQVGCRRRAAPAHVTSANALLLLCVYVAPTAGVRQCLGVLLGGVRDAIQRCVCPCRESYGRLRVLLCRAVVCSLVRCRGGRSPCRVEARAAGANVSVARVQ